MDRAFSYSLNDSYRSYEFLTMMQMNIVFIFNQKILYQYGTPISQP